MPSVLDNGLRRAARVLPDFVRRLLRGDKPSHAKPSDATPSPSEKPVSHDSAGGDGGGGGG